MRFNSENVTNGTVVLSANGPRHTDGYPHWVVPYGLECAKIALTGEDGRPVDLAAPDKRFGNAPIELSTMKIYHRPALYYYGDDNPLEILHFEIDDLFLIKHSGAYRLEVVPQLYLYPSNQVSKIHLTNWPSVSLIIQLKPNCK